MVLQDNEFPVLRGMQADTRPTVAYDFSFAFLPLSVGDWTK